MNKVKGFICLAVFLSIGMGLSFAEDEATPAAVSEPNGIQHKMDSPSDTAMVEKDADVQWVWGEVTNLDLKDNIIILKHLDPEDNQDKEISIGVDASTTFENIKSLEEIKPQDFLSIDYVITQDGKNLAKNIGLDRPKESQGAVSAAATGEVKEPAGAVEHPETEKQSPETGQ